MERDWLEPVMGRYTSDCPPLLRNGVIGGFAGFGIAAVAFVGYAVLSEVLHPARIAPGMIIRSYGQVWGLNLVVAGLFSLAVGWSVALSVHRQRLAAAMLSLLACVATTRFALASWNDSIANYGPDQSDAIVYLPLLILSGIVAASTVIAVAGFVVSLLAGIFRGKTG